jgi:hypothetical protein
MKPLDDVEAWLDDVVVDNDSSLLWRGHGALSLDDVMILVEEVAHMMGHCT